MGLNLMHPRFEAPHYFEALRSDTENDRVLLSEAVDVHVFRSALARQEALFGWNAESSLKRHRNLASSGAVGRP